MIRRLTICVLALALATASSQPALSQNSLGSLLRGLSRKADRSHDPFADMQVQTFKVEFALRGSQVVFVGAQPSQILTESRQSCVDRLSGREQTMGTVAGDPASTMANYRRGYFKPNQRVVRSGDEYRISAMSCGPVSTEPGTVIDSPSEAEFRAVGIDVPTLVADANAYLQETQLEAANAAAEKQAAAKRQAVLDQLWLQASALYLANGELYGLKTDQYAPFKSVEDCKTATIKKRRAFIIEGLGSRYPIGESVIGFSDGSGWEWMGCVLVKDEESGAYANYMNKRMTSARAKELKLIPAIQ